MVAHLKYNWPELRKEYVEGLVGDDGERWWPSQEELGAMRGVPRNRMSERAAKEGWTQERATFRENLERHRNEVRAVELARESVEVDRKALEAAKLGLMLVGERMNEITDEVRAGKLVREADPDAFHLPSMDVRELEALSRTAIGWHSLAEKALGEIPTVRTEVTGAGGAPIEHSIRAELTRDDPERIAAFALAAERAGLLGLLAGSAGEIGPAGEEDAVIEEEPAPGGDGAPPG